MSWVELLNTFISGPQKFNVYYLRPLVLMFVRIAAMAYNILSESYLKLYTTIKQ